MSEGKTECKNIIRIKIRSLIEMLVKNKITTGNIILFPTIIDMRETDFLYSVMIYWFSETLA